MRKLQELLHGNFAEVYCLVVELLVIELPIRMIDQLFPIYQLGSSVQYQLVG